MFVVRTIPQLEEALRHNAREVMVVGKLAPEILEKSTIPFAQILLEKFNVCETREKSGNSIAVLSRRE